jgi:hypothetical protein
MKKLTVSPKEAILFTLKKKFKDAGCECSLKADKHKTTLSIGYANIIQLSQSRRSVR